MSAALRDYQNVYQFEISIRRIKPKVWRRILVPENYNFRELHLAIICCMRWSNMHLHKFVLTSGTQLFGKSIEINKNISDYFKAPKDKALYEYDFGCPWEHNVIFEQILPADPNTEYPKCISGSQPTPIEDESDPDKSDSEGEDDEDEVDHLLCTNGIFDPNKVDFINFNDNL